MTFFEVAIIPWKVNIGPVRLGRQALRVGRIARHETESLRWKKMAGRKRWRLRKPQTMTRIFWIRALSDSPERNFIGRGR